ncbi:hypothetical protein Poli38472_010342 [Pythium oligandrum]|uniref:Legume lectin domain-containing protein n=1 Tax=Pythium oligandrum TaxID=41045 RepID=A0A8K1C2Y4_PYTOL|nr:hypothetical protein Poli38472_010342 [Pythium oligandrum]|eukprot:TMW55460.1 hypothetical protein Poli38472_010342 [Pythium oligandrum]
MRSTAIWALVASVALFSATHAVSIASQQLRGVVSDVCEHFLQISDYAAGHCNISDFNTMDSKCVESFELFYETPSLLLDCEKHAEAQNAKVKMLTFIDIYSRWQQHHTCELFHAKEKKAAVSCGGADVHRIWQEEAWPLYCDEIFELYKANRKEIDASCERTQYSDAFWEAYADYIALPICKTYYERVRDTVSHDCDTNVHTPPCNRMFSWYLRYQAQIERECLEVQGAKPFYKGFYAWKHSRGRQGGQMATYLAPVRVLLVSLAIQWSTCFAEFVYYDFNGTTGLILNGDAATSSCIHIARNDYSDRAGADDVREASIEMIQHQRLERVMTETVETEDHSTSARIAVETARVGHRDAFVKSLEERCAVRLRLTASQPRQISSVWYSEQLPVLQGFETRFTFQISDQSKRCYEVKDENFGTRHYRSCTVHGGDGFAFVIHSNPSKTAAVGYRDAKTQSQMGYEGIQNSLAIEFDTWHNGETPDTFYDHVAIYSNGADGNSLLESARLSTTALQDIADGRIHAVKIRYYNELKYEYVSYFSGTASLTTFIKDVSEGRRVGTLVVFADDGIDKDVPLLAIPINLAVALRLTSDQAYVGFTASTGNSWQKHDILGWYYCTQPPCLDQYGTEMTFAFDYNQQSMVSTASHQNNLYPIYIYPDSTPWVKKQTYFATTQRVGLIS